MYSTSSKHIKCSLQFLINLHLPASSQTKLHRMYTLYLSIFSYIHCRLRATEIPQFLHTWEQEGVIYLINSQFCSAARRCVFVSLNADAHAPCNKTNSGGISSRDVSPWAGCIVGPGDMSNVRCYVYFGHARNAVSGSELY